jgi:hypothetical protein
VPTSASSLPFLRAALITAKAAFAAAISANILHFHCCSKIHLTVLLSRLS